MSTSLTRVAGVHWLALAVVCAAVVLRLGAIDRQGLWVDEVFSLAMATGHSLEHAAAVADPSLGDFVEGAQPLSPEAFRRYAEHDTPAAGLGRVVRAVRLSDTSPPLYYMLLNQWLRHAGTSDTALRMFSLLWAVACLPLIWVLARQIGGPASALLACVLFGFAPVAVHYSLEGRMYSMLWFLALATAWLALRLHLQGARVHSLLLLILVSTAGLLTHYFYTFVWAAIALWLLWQPGRFDRRGAVGTFAVAGLLALPWYVGAVGSMEDFRVTKGWLEWPRSDYRMTAIPLELAFNFFSNRPGDWVNLPPMRWVAVCLAVLATAVWRWRLGSWIATGSRTLLWLWAGAACVGPLAFDLAFGTYTGAVPRYALAGLPAAFLIVAVGLSRLSPRVAGVAVCALVLVWIPGLRGIYANVSRGSSPLREVARMVDERSGSGDVVLVQSIPSGVVGVARYLSKPVPMAPWVGRLGKRRVPDDLEALVSGRRRILLVKAHDVGGSGPEDALRARGILVSQTSVNQSWMLEFVPRHGNVFFERDHRGRSDQLIEVGTH